MRITVQGAAGVHEMLADYMVTKLPKRLQDATKASASVFKEPLKSAARPLSKRLARSVSVRTARKDKPASIVAFRPKVAFFRHFVIGGTKAHGPRRAKALVFDGRHGLVTTKHVRGTPPHPIVEQVFRANESKALTALDRALDRTETT